MISFILPTHNRPETLQRTLGKLGALEAAELPRGCEVIVVDNASVLPVRADGSLGNGLPVRTIRRARNDGAAGRNAAAAAARQSWLFMLDDDSYPMRGDIAAVLEDVEDDVAAVGAQIVLPGGRREDGGLPEVFIGCGVAIRREAFLTAGGYDASFHYYVEEYDLAAKLIRAGGRVVHDFRIMVRHEKIAGGRDMNLILQRLVRNNAWVAQRYAPEPQREPEIARIISRYGQVALRERAGPGFAQGMAELAASLPRQRRTPHSDDEFNRFTGLAAVREALNAEPIDWSTTHVAIVDEGKNCWVVRQALDELAVPISDDESNADALVIGTISPGPMMDALERRRDGTKPVIAPWRPRSAASSPLLAH